METSFNCGEIHFLMLLTWQFISRKVITAVLRYIVVLLSWIKRPIYLCSLFYTRSKLVLFFHINGNRFFSDWMTIILAYHFEWIINPMSFWSPVSINNSWTCHNFIIKDHWHSNFRSDHNCSSLPSLKKWHNFGKWC